MTDFAKYKLGKKPPKHLVGLPSLGGILGDPSVVLPTPPVRADYGDKIKQFSMFLNDQLGCCTVSAIGAAIETWSSWARPKEDVLPDSTILRVYEIVGGYVNGDPNTDNGAACADVLRYWFEHPIDIIPLNGFVSLRPGNHNDIMVAVWLFGVCYIGVQLPLTAQNGPWDVPPDTSILTGNSAAGSWGGHCVPIVAYDETGLTCITWGTLKKMTWAFWDAYCDEAFGLVSKDWIEASGKTPPGVLYTKLMADMEAFRNKPAIKIEVKKV